MANAPDTTDGTLATVAPYGSWKSPVTSDLIVQGSIGLGLIALDGADTYWIEVRPSEGGRSVIVCRDRAGRTHDVTPAGFNARTRVMNTAAATTQSPGALFTSPTSPTSASIVSARQATMCRNR